MLYKRVLNGRAEVRSQIWRECGGKCHHCGKELDPFLDFHLDHLVELAAGGPDSIENLVGSCAKCNQTRSAGKFGTQPPVLRMQPVEFQKYEGPALTVESLARRWKMTTSTVLRLIRRGDLVSVPLSANGGHLIPTVEIARFEREYRSDYRKTGRRAEGAASG